MSALSFRLQSSQLVRAGTTRAHRRANLLAARAVEPKQDAAPSTSGKPDDVPTGPTFKREFVENGARIIETDGKLTGPEDEKDFWEGENMEAVGKFFERFFLPGLVVLGLLCGAFAARTYNDDADVFIAPPSGPDAEPVVIPAGALAPAPTVVQAPSPASQ